MNESKLNEIVVRSLPITKQMVWQAYRKVKANKGSAGIDDQSIEMFDADLSNNLYKLWNRLSSGSYFPEAVKSVEIPKGNGKVRTLGIPTVNDRIAQMVVKMHLEPKLDPLFHRSSFGYRPGKSAHQAIEQATTNCRKFDMVIDLDIQGFFDGLDHSLLLKALRRHTQEKWVLLYIGRWLQAPVQTKQGEIVTSIQGIPQGGVISPLLANLFLHYCFDKWMDKQFPKLPFERYADDIIVHCYNPQQAQMILDCIEQRFNQCMLKVHPEKTKIVYCKDSNRYRRNYPQVSFTFLGYDFKPRRCKNSKDGRIFYGFSPAISRQARKKIIYHLRSFQIHRRTQATLEDLSQLLNAKLRGWINYYGKYRKSALHAVFYGLNNRLFKWARWKYKKYRKNRKGAIKWLRRVAREHPDLFVHWQHGFTP